MRTDTYKWRAHYIITQHFLERVLSLTTSPVIPLNFAGVLWRLGDDTRDNSTAGDCPTVLPAPVRLWVVRIDPFSGLPLLLDWARCFFRSANVPAMEWSTVWASLDSRSVYFSWFIHRGFGGFIFGLFIYFFFLSKHLGVKEEK